VQGKTVQVASFLGAMILSRRLDSILLVSPATMLDHWLRELSIWAPGLRRILVHKSAENSDGFSREVSTVLLKKLDKWLTRARSEFYNEPLPRGDDDSMDSTDDEEDTFCGNGYVVSLILYCATLSLVIFSFDYRFWWFAYWLNAPNYLSTINNYMTQVITTYENLRKNVDVWVKHDWGMVVIDEGQKIKNPDADVTLACKRIRTPHRLLVTATPISNDLVELWSLFDFVVPGRLGTLPSFESEFAEPIKRGGYANASPMQVQLAYRCALVLRDLVNPYMLRRLKKDIEEVQRCVQTLRVLQILTFIATYKIHLFSLLNK
jgi:DNA excision repair protein ERCC-6